MQYLTQVVVAVLLLWNVTVSKSASTASREFLSRLETSEDDLSEDNNSRNSHRDLSNSRPDPPALGSSWRVREDDGRSPSATLKQTHDIDNYGPTGFFTHDGQLTEGSSSLDKFRPPPPRLYSNGHRQSPVTTVERISEQRQPQIGVNLISGHQRHDQDREEMDEQPIMDQDTRILRAHLRNVINKNADAFDQDIRKHLIGAPTRFFIPQSHTSFVVPPTAFQRTSKRSASCLRKCMAMGFLHPSQCHSLC